MATIREGKQQEMLGNPYGIASYSNFDLGYKHATTEIFGLLLPYEVRDAVTGDEHKLSNKSTEKSYTLQAPLMSKVWKNKEWFLVPRMAILPNAWEKIYTQPTVGQDVDATKVGTSIPATEWTKFLNEIKSKYDSALTALQALDASSTGTAISAAVNSIVKNTIIMEYIFSYGSLLNRLGCSMASLYHAKNGYPFDINFDLVFTGMFHGWKVEWDSNGDIMTVSKDVNDNSTNRITIREFLQKGRDNLNFEIFGIYASTTNFIRFDTTDATEKTTLLAWITTWINLIKDTHSNSYTYAYSHPVDLARLWAYQLICAEYYTDDQVDYIYNAQIYREYMSDIVKKILIINNHDSQTYTYYTVNGINIPYDWLSSNYFSEMITAFMTSRVNAEDYLTALFNINRSLKFKDYFTGGRTRPIATNDVIVNTTGNQFSVIDLSKSTQETRFRMAIQRIGRKIGEFAKGLFGVDQAPDYHYPLWIGKTTDIIHAEETENTGADQYTKVYAVTSRFTGYSNQYGFKARCDRDCILMGITYYDVERFYFRGVDRHFMHVDRFDYFNSFMQYTGDQPVYTEEYDAALTGANSGYFAYKPTYEEFKEGINRADSGFITSLDGFIFLDDVNEKQFYNKNQRILNKVSPDFIRSKPVELDRFYTQITGFSLGTYFHFICVYENENSAERPMAYNPTINI